MRSTANIFVIIFSFLSFSYSLYAQEKNELKVGLCLSSGGAKGLAHIGLLKLIDSLGIKIDFITGASMGSIVGGLYAAGYTGNQIEEIARTANWDVLLNLNAPMNKIYMDEKDEFGRYIAEISIRRRKLYLTGLIEGQELLNLLMRLTKHVNHISDFTKLPIPFKCLAVDIEKISPVVLDSGSLAIAMRASMAIPSVFKPVKRDDQLLVDGGLMVNFPVRQVKEMGANFVIGSYTGGRLLEVPEMNTVDKLLLQSSIFFGINECREDIKQCNVFSNLTENMSPFGAGDFKKANEIIDEGIIIAREVLPKLIELANMQKANGIIYKKENLVQPNTFLKVETISIDTVYSEQMNKFIRNRVTFKEGDSISFKDLEKTVRKIYATRMFFKTYYELEEQQNGNYLVKLKVEQDNKFRVKAALHYDTEQGAGFLFNVTARNWLGKGSRLFATVDLAEFLKYRINYRKYIAQTNLSFNVDFLRDKAPLVFLDSTGHTSATENYYERYQSLNIGFNYNISIPASLYLGAIGEKDKLLPKYHEISNQNNAPGENIWNLNHITTYAFGLVGKFNFNTLNRFVFPNKGTEIFIENKFRIIATESYSYSIITFDSTRNSNYEWNYSMREESDTSFFFPYDKLLLKICNYFPVHKRLSVVSGLNAGFTYSNIMKYDTSTYPLKNKDWIDKNNLSEFSPEIDAFFFGGTEQRARTNFIPLGGIRDGFGIEQNFLNLRLALQYEALHKLFITPSVNYFYTSSSSHSSSYSYYSPDTSFYKDVYVNTSSNPKYFFKNITQTTFRRGYDYYYTSYSNKINYDEFGNFISATSTSNTEYYSSYAILTYGINIGYKSPVGPINFNISNQYEYKADWYKHWRFYFSIGYRF